MDKESTNWCRIAHTLMQKGGEVLRQFLILEILTQSFHETSRYWMENVYEFSKISLSIHSCQLTSKSPKPIDRILDNLLKSWNIDPDKQVGFMERKEWLKQCKDDIEKERNNSISSSVNAIFAKWLSYIEKEITDMTPLCKFVTKINDTFHKHLKNAQISLLLEIEKNEGFLSRCCQKLKSLSVSSSCEFQQLLQHFKTELNNWKGKCRTIFENFTQKCENIIKEKTPVVKEIPHGYGVDKFFNRLQAKLKDCNSDSQVHTFCDVWDDRLHTVFDIYEKKTKEDSSTDAILRLSQRLCDELEHFPSFKETKIIRFLNSFDVSKLPGYLQKYYLNLNKISRSSELSKLDLTKLTTILRYGNLVHSMQKQSNDEPSKWDTSISADIWRLRIQRNDLVGHIAELKLPNDIFETQWKDLTELLLKIAFRCGEQFSMNIGRDINKIKNCSLESDKEYELQKEFLTWCKNDILAQLSTKSTAASQCLDMLQSIQTALENLARRRKACSCRLCNNDFSAESELAEHMRVHQDCRCLSCKKTFSTEIELTNHMKDHQDRFCRSCKMACLTEWEFRRHMWCNQDCKCTDCDLIFLTEGAFEEHVSKHKALKCRICKKVYPTESEFSHHMLCHQVRTCLSCKKDLPNQNEFEQHMRNHEARTCRSCKKNFFTPLELDDHIKVHQDRTCRSCKMDFSTEIELEVHKMNHEERSCRICSKELSTVIELEEHMKYH